MIGVSPRISTIPGLRGEAEEKRTDEMKRKMLGVRSYWGVEEKREHRTRGRDFGFLIFNFGLEESFARCRGLRVRLSFEIQNLTFNITRRRA